MAFSLEQLAARLALLAVQLDALEQKQHSDALGRPFGAFTEQYHPPAYYPSCGETSTTNPSLPGGGSDPTAVAHSYAFETWANAAKTGILMVPGDVFLGPLTWIHWGDISSATTTPAVSDTDVCVWLEVNISTPAAVMVVGSRAAMESALDATEQQNTTVVPLVETTWVDAKITKVKNLQCGDVKIFRAAN